MQKSSVLVIIAVIIIIGSVILFHGGSKQPVPTLKTESSTSSAEQTAAPTVTPRAIDMDEAGKLDSNLSAYKGQRFVVVDAANCKDDETSAYISRIVSILQNAGWTFAAKPCVDVKDDDRAYGLRFCLKSTFSFTPKAGDALADTFKKLKIPFEHGFGKCGFDELAMKDGDIGVVVGKNPELLNTPPAPAPVKPAATAPATVPALAPAAAPTAPTAAPAQKAAIKPATGKKQPAAATPAPEQPAQQEEPDADSNKASSVPAEHQD